MALEKLEQPNLRSAKQLHLKAKANYMIYLIRNHSTTEEIPHHDVPVS